MKPTDKRFWIAWLVLLLMSIVSCMAEGWSEDTALLGAAYTLSLLSAWLCHRVRPRAALGNMIVMIAYNAILSYNLVFNSHDGAGLTWWFFILLLNTIHSIGLLIYTSIIRFIKINH
ncbi:hypothetical protein [uncultured Duncaniella sp.]|uniref:hypothetical protein n=1 Tax=uncultured Duncaniella sp. TaxID=2768039 RepID=UPI00259D09B4|nr:hypothetical protein [uncultured Duncaniella sp.]